MLNGVRVLDVSTGIAGGYCTKLLADAGAHVVKVEQTAADKLRMSPGGGLWTYLNRSKRVVQGQDCVLADELRVADVALTDDPAQAAQWHELFPSLVVVSISAFGRDGPWAGRPATDFTLQAACGSMGSRGEPDQPPLPAGGRIGEWLTGTYGALAAAASVGCRGLPASGRWVDVAMLDCMAVTLVTCPSVFASFLGWPPLKGTGRTIEVPSVEPTKDDYVVFTTNSAQQFEDFVTLIGRPDWVGTEMAGAMNRFGRRQEFVEAVHAWTTTRTSEEALSEASLLRIPTGPVLNGSTVADFEQFVARGVYRRSPDGRFREPRSPYRMDPAAPASGPSRRAPVPRRPLEGVRILDCTAWWAGPSAGHAMGCLGADVIKVESVKRPDLMRMSTTKPADEGDWWEWGPVFHAVNTSKRGVTLDLARPEGVDMFERLARTADVVIENYTPRVMDQFGLGWERLHEVNRRLIMVRMPAFGLDGPWRDRTGFAQTMECISGMAWVTGNPDGPPVLPRGACDPLAGMHAVFATLMALRARDADGQGRMVESTMVEAALNVTAEQVIEWDIAGRLLGREGMRGGGMPQGVYRCAGEDEWVAVSVCSDDQWESFCEVARFQEGGAWARSEERRAAADEIDALVAAWCASRTKEDAAETLQLAGVPAAAVVSGRDIVNNPQLRHRGLFEVEDHPVTGRHDIPGLPFRMSGVDTWMTRPSPTLGQHNEEVLIEVASTTELSELRQTGTIGERLVQR